MTEEQREDILTSLCIWFRGRIHARDKLGMVAIVKYYEGILHAIGVLYGTDVMNELEKRVEELNPSPH